MVMIRISLPLMTMAVDMCNYGHNILRLYQIFFSPQVKQSVIINNKHGIYELLNELPNDLRLRTLRNQERTLKPQKINELFPSAQSSPQNKNFVDTIKKLLNNTN